MGKKISSINTLTFDEATQTLHVDTLEEDGKGSKVTMALKQVADGTKVKYSASLELGRLGLFAKGPAKGQFENTLTKTWPRWTRSSLSFEQPSCSQRSLEPSGM
ncbi:MAG: hypothetical protein JRN46_06030 [Nitrososphaerota archaeon]|nr:hypothetical protein [Nitrososphaerota archaeon]